MLHSAGGKSAESGWHEQGCAGNVTLSRSVSALPDGINGSQRPNLVPGQSLYPANQSPNLRLNPAGFYNSCEWHVGKRGPEHYPHPRRLEADASLEKRFQITERIGISFRWDVFNVFNHAQIGKASLTWTDPSKGTMCCYDYEPLSDIGNWHWHSTSNAVHVASSF